MSLQADTIERDAPVRSPVTLPWSTRFDLASEISGRTYRICVFRPPVPAPASGYPLLVALDGNMTFPIAGAMAATYAFAMAPVLVVGVGYPTESPIEFSTNRFRDLTPPTPPEGIPRRPGIPALGPEAFGGADLFRRFLTEELRPAIAAAENVDPAREALFGYSLSGLFVLDTLFKQPSAYRSYIAASPSIWWNDLALLKHEAGFARAVAAQEASPRVLIAIGAREQELPYRMPPGMSLEDVEELVSEGRMVDNAWELATRLGRITGDGYAACFHAFEDEDHLTCLAAAIGRALDFATRD
jgi:predicted alpha/beta superfamily hydrolase